MSELVSTYERLPKFDTDVLMYHKDSGTMYVGSVIMVNNKDISWTVNTGDGYYSDLDNPPDFWRDDLPNPPKENSNAET